MKKIPFSLFFILFPIILFSQNYGKYSLPHTSDIDVLQKYVGQKVVFYSSHGYSSSLDDYDEDIFKNTFWGKCDRTYTIKKIKVGSQIMIDLVDSTNWRIKVKVNIDGERNRKGLKSCNGFFLLDEFEKDQAFVSKPQITNKRGDEVATILGHKMVVTEGGYPQHRIIIKSNYCDAIFLCKPDEVNQYCSDFLSVLTHSKVKASYQIVGLEENEDGTYNYLIKNSITNEIKTCSYGSTSEAFAEDLDGHYVSVLSYVEKPSNPEIRYGETTIIEDNPDNITGYSYKDNIIDMTILGYKDEFKFTLKNLSNNSIKIVWNDAVFVGFDGITSKIMHQGTKYSQRDGDQPSTTIIKGALVKDVIIPNCNVKYSEYLNEWLVLSMYPKEQGLDPGQIRVMIPIQVKDVINEYIFVFDIKYIFKHPERLHLEAFVL